MCPRGHDQNNVVWPYICVYAFPKQRKDLSGWGRSRVVRNHKDNPFSWFDEFCWVLNPDGVLPRVFKCPFNCLTWRMLSSENTSQIIFRDIYFY